MSEKTEKLIGKTAHSQMEFRSEAAKSGRRISPTWMPDDIGTENFKKSTTTAYLRKMN